MRPLMRRLIRFLPLAPAAVCVAAVYLVESCTGYPVHALSEGPPIPKLHIVENLEGKKIVRYERDGLNLFAEVFVPEGRGRRPAVVVIPGGFDGPNANNRALSKQLAKMGFLVALPHLRGTGRSEGGITFCLEEGQDVRALARAMPQIGGTGRYCYVGISFGAAIALNAGRDDPDLRGIAHVFGPTDFIQQLDMLSGWGMKDKVERWHDWIGGSPEDNPEAYAARDPLQFAKSVLAPLLIVQAGKDVLIPARQAARLAWAREEAGRIVHRKALGPEGEPWPDALSWPSAVIEPLSGRGPAHEDNLLFFEDLPHKTNEAVLDEVARSVKAWLDP